MGGNWWTQRPRSRVMGVRERQQWRADQQAAERAAAMQALAGFSMQADDAPNGLPGPYALNVQAPLAPNQQPFTFNSRPIPQSGASFLDAQRNALSQKAGDFGQALQQGDIGGAVKQVAEETAASQLPEAWRQFTERPGLDTGLNVGAAALGAIFTPFMPKSLYPVLNAPTQAIKTGLNRAAIETSTPAGREAGDAFLNALNKARREQGKSETPMLDPNRPTLKDEAASAVSLLGPDASAKYRNERLDNRKLFGVLPLPRAVAEAEGAADPVNYLNMAAANVTGEKEQTDFIWRAAAGENPYVIQNGLQMPRDDAPDDQKAQFQTSVDEFIAARGRIARAQAARGGASDAQAMRAASEAEEEARRIVNRTGMIPSAADPMKEMAMELAIGLTPLDPINKLPLTKLFGWKALQKLPVIGNAARRISEAIPAVEARAKADWLDQVYDAEARTIAGGVPDATMAEKLAETTTGVDVGTQRNAARAQAMAVSSANSPAVRQMAKWYLQHTRGKGYTDTTRAYIMEGHAQNILNEFARRSQTPADLLTKVGTFVAAPEQLIPELGNLPVSVRAEAARPVIEKIINQIPELPSMADQAAPLNYGAFLADLDGLTNQAAREVVGVKPMAERSAIEKLAHAQKRIMGEFFLRSPGFIIRNAISDTVIAAQDGLHAREGFEAMRQYLDGFGITPKDVAGRDAITDINPDTGQPMRSMFSSDKSPGLVRETVGRWQDFMGGVNNKFETQRRVSAYGAAFKKLWPKQWTPKISPEARAAMGPEAAGLLDQIETATRGARSEADIRAAVSRILNPQNAGDTWSATGALDKAGVGPDSISPVQLAEIEARARQLASEGADDATIDAAFQGYVDEVLDHKRRAIASMGDVVHPRQDTHAAIEQDLLDHANAAKQAAMHMAEAGIINPAEAAEFSRRWVDELVQAENGVRDLRAEALAALRQMPENADPTTVTRLFQWAMNNEYGARDRYRQTQMNLEQAARVKSDKAMNSRGNAAGKQQLIRNVWEEYHTANNANARRMFDEVNGGYRWLADATAKVIEDPRRFDEVVGDRLKIETGNPSADWILGEMRKLVGEQGVEDFRKVLNANRFKVELPRRETWRQATQVARAEPALATDVLDVLMASERSVQEHAIKTVMDNRLLLTKRDKGAVDQAEYRRAVDANWNKHFDFAAYVYGEAAEARLQWLQVRRSTTAEALRQMGVDDGTIAQLFSRIHTPEGQAAIKLALTGAAPRMVEDAARGSDGNLPPAPSPGPTGPTGSRTTATGADPNRSYDFRYRLVPLSDLIASHTDTLEPDPRFPPALQPRDRSRAASQMQVDRIAQTLNPEALLNDAGTIDRGSPIIGPDSIVESGNGRVLAMRRARDANPAGWQAYQDALRSRLDDFGLDPAAYQPDSVLVRERLSDVDRAAFAAEANGSSVLTMSPAEVARADAARVPQKALHALDVADGQTLDAALLKAGNRDLVAGFLKALPANERAALVTDTGALNQEGLRRIRSALFAKTYGGTRGGEAGTRLARVFSESTDGNIANVQQGMMGSLARMAQADSLIASGARDAGLAVADDIASAVDVFSRLKAEGVSVNNYLAQASLFSRELDPFQESVLRWLDASSRSPKKIREALDEYARRVIDAPAVGQASLVPGVSATKAEIWDIVTGSGLPPTGQALRKVDSGQPEAYYGTSGQSEQQGIGGRLPQAQAGRTAGDVQGDVAAGGNRGTDAAAVREAGSGDAAARTVAAAPPGGDGLDSRPDSAGNDFNPLRAYDADRRQRSLASGDAGSDINAATRRGTTPAQRDAGLDALADLESRATAQPGRRPKVQLLASGIAADFRGAGKASIIGQTIRTPDDLAAAGQAFRDPRFETARYFFTKGGQVVYEAGYSSRLPGATTAFVNRDGYASLRSWLRGQLRTTGSDAFWMVHNHPDGVSEPSTADILLTQDLGGEFKREFQGHVVINSGEYTFIAPSGMPERATRDFGADELLKASLDSPLLGQQLRNNIDAVRLAKATEMLAPEKAVLIGQTPDRGVQAIASADIPDMSTEALRRRVVAASRQFARNTGSMELFIVLPYKLPRSGKARELFEQAVRQNVFSDIVDIDGDSVRASFKVEPEADTFFGMSLQDQGRTLWAAGGKKSKYDPNQGSFFEATQPSMLDLQRIALDEAARRIEGAADRIADALAPKQPDLPATPSGLQAGGLFDTAAQDATPLKAQPVTAQGALFDLAEDVAAGRVTPDDAQARVRAAAGETSPASKMLRRGDVVRVAGRDGVYFVDRVNGDRITVDLVREYRPGKWERRIEGTIDTNALTRVGTYNFDTGEPVIDAPQLRSAGQSVYDPRAAVGDPATLRDQDAAIEAGQQEGIHYTDLVSAATDESLRAIQALRDGFKEHVKTQPAPRQSLTPAQRKALDAQVKALTQQFYDTRRNVATQARSLTDRSLLDYNLKRGYDTALGMVVPFSYWATRQGRNYLMRFATNPAILAQWSRYKYWTEKENEKNNVRGRFGSSQRIPLSAMFPDAGLDDVYVNPEAVLFPFAQWFAADTSDQEKNAVQAWYDRAASIGARPGPLIDIPLRMSGLLATKQPGEKGYGEEQAAYGRQSVGQFIPQTGVIQGLTAAADIGGPTGVDIEGPVRRALGLSEGEPWDAYRISRSVSDLAAYNNVEAGTLDERPYLIAQQFIDAHGQTDLPTALRDYKAADLAKDFNVDMPMATQALQIAREAARRATQQRGFSQLASFFGGMRAQPLPQGEQMRWAMRDEERAAAFNPYTQAGSAAEVQQVRQAFPALSVQRAQYASLPGDEKDYGYLFTAAQRNQVNQRFDALKDAAIAARPYDRRTARLIENARYAALATVESDPANLDAQAAWQREYQKVIASLNGQSLPEAEQMAYYPKSTAGATPAEALRIRQNEAMRFIAATQPEFETFVTVDGEPDYDAYRLAVSEWERQLPLVAAGLPQVAEVLAKADTEGRGDAVRGWLGRLSAGDLAEYRRRNDSPLEAAQRTYFDAVYQPTMDAFRRLKEAGDPDAYAKTIGNIGPMGGADLMPIVREIYGDRFTDEDLQRDVSAIQMPALRDVMKANQSPQARAKSEAQETFWNFYREMTPPGREGAGLRDIALVQAALDPAARATMTTEQYRLAGQMARGWIVENYGEVSPALAAEWQQARAEKTRLDAALVARFGRQSISLLSAYDYARSAEDKEAVRLRFPEVEDMLKIRLAYGKANPLYDYYYRPGGGGKKKGLGSGRLGGGQSGAASFNRAAGPNRLSSRSGEAGAIDRSAQTIVR